MRQATLRTTPCSALPMSRSDLPRPKDTDFLSRLPTEILQLILENLLVKSEWPISLCLAADRLYVNIKPHIRHRLELLAEPEGLPRHTSILVASRRLREISIRLLLSRHILFFSGVGEKPRRRLRHSPAYRYSVFSLSAQYLHLARRVFITYPWQSPMYTWQKRFATMLLLQRLYEYKVNLELFILCADVMQIEDEASKAIMDQMTEDHHVDDYITECLIPFFTNLESMAPFALRLYDQTEKFYLGSFRQRPGFYSGLLPVSITDFAKGFKLDVTDAASIVNDRQVVEDEESKIGFLLMEGAARELWHTCIVCFQDDVDLDRKCCNVLNPWKFEKMEEVLRVNDSALYEEHVLSQMKPALWTEDTSCIQCGRELLQNGSRQSGLCLCDRTRNVALREHKKAEEQKSRRPPRSDRAAEPLYEVDRRAEKLAIPWSDFEALRSTLSWWSLEVAARAHGQQSITKYLHSHDNASKL